VLVQLGGELAQPSLDRFEVGAEFVRSVSRLQPAFVERSMPFRGHRTEIDVEHVRGPTCELGAARMVFHRHAREAEQRVQAFESRRFDAVLIRLRLRRDAGAQLG
jgi:hypothetical protein